jgi:hypothetical protein
VITNIALAAGDDPVFLAGLNGMVARLAADRQPGVVYAIRITKWFDHKWLRYSGKGRVAFRGLTDTEDTALEIISGDRLTFPPFSPRQVATQRTWRRQSDGGYKRALKLRHPHSRTIRHSSFNLQNRLIDFSESALFVWFSSGTLAAGLAAVLIYGVQGHDVEAWYASFLRRTSWQVGQTKGISRKHVEAAFPLKTGTA